MLSFNPLFYISRIRICLAKTNKSLTKSRQNQILLNPWLVFFMLSSPYNNKENKRALVFRFMITSIEMNNNNSDNKYHLWSLYCVLGTLLIDNLTLFSQYK